MSTLDTQVGGDHYRKMKIQPIEFIVANELEFRVANIVKYVCRYKDKNGLQDLEKAQHYLDMLKEELQAAKIQVQANKATVGADKIRIHEGNVMQHTLRWDPDTCSFIDIY